MAIIRTTLRGFPRELRRRLKNDRELLHRAAAETVARGEHHAVRLTDQHDKVDTGAFKRAWGHDSAANPSLYNDAPYAGIIEWGRRPGAPGPPLAPILAWVQRKLVGNGQVAPEDAASVAFVIRRAIHRKGSRPTFILRDTAAHFPSWLSEAATRLLNR